MKAPPRLRRRIMRYGERKAILSEDVRTVVRGEDALIHNLSNGSWCRISSFAAGFFGREGGIDLAGEAARIGNGDAVGMLRLAAELADAGMLVEKGKDVKSKSRRVAKAYLIVTRRCNLTCPDCYMGVAADAEYDLQTTRLAAMKLKTMRPNRIYVTGGEPCMRDDLPEILTDLAGTQSVLCTNGTLPDKIPFGLLKRLGFGLQISVESCKSVDHDAIRGAGCHEAARKTAEMAAGLGIKVEIVPTVKAESGFAIDEMLGFAHEIGTSCHASLLVGAGKAKGRAGLNSNNLLRSIVDYLGKCLSRGEIDDNAVLEDIAPLISKKSCGAGERIISCTGDGMLHPCHLLWDKPLEFGKLAMDVDSNPFCTGCDVRYLCGGGCMAAAAANGGLDPNCQAYKSLLTAFAWKWDDSQTVSDNVRRIAGHVDQACAHDCSCN